MIRCVIWLATYVFGQWTLLVCLFPGSVNLRCPKIETRPEYERVYFSRIVKHGDHVELECDPL